MAEKYEVVKAWHGVSVGDVIVLEGVHPALKSHVRRMSGSVLAELVPANPEASTGNKTRKEIITARLDELGIEYKGSLGADRLAELLPDGELETLFPTTE